MKETWKSEAEGYLRIVDILCVLYHTALLLLMFS